MTVDVMQTRGFFYCQVMFLTGCVLINSYYHEGPDTIDWKWWLKYPELHEAVNTMRGHEYIKYSPTVTASDIIQSLISTNTHAWGIQGTGPWMKLRRENLLNFSNRFGLLNHGGRYIDIIDNQYRGQLFFVASKAKAKLNPNHRGRVTCAEGHLGVFRKFLASNYSNALIFEDDVIENDGFQKEEVMKFLIHSLNLFQKKKWDVLFLGYCFAANKTFDENFKVIQSLENELFLKSCASHCTHAYVVNRFAAKIFETEISTKFTDLSVTGIDTMFGDLINFYGNFIH